MVGPRVHIPQSFSVLFWLFLLIIGAVTGLIAFVTSLSVSLCLRNLSTEVSFPALADDHPRFGHISLFVVLNLVAVLLAALLVLYVSPVAAGSGIPNMYGYLNGVDIPPFLNIRVALAKVPGSILAVAGGLCIGKEGPLLHIGSIVATWLGNTQLFQGLRSRREHEPLTYDRHTRELVTCGAAAGLAAGFQAPVGGLLFALEMSSRWRHELTARTLFACAVVALVSQALRKIQSDSETLKYGSLLFFKDAVHFPTPYKQIPLMAILGVLGGFIGCLFTTLNIALGTRRKAYASRKGLRILEVGCVGLLTTALRLILPLLGRCRDCLCDLDKQSDIGNEEEKCQCAPGAPDLKEFDLYGCNSGTYNDMAVFMYNPQGYLIKALFTAPYGAFTGSSLLLLLLFSYILSILTYGMAIPAGLFTPSLITGGALGQLFAFCVNKFLHAMGFSSEIDPGFYALLGAASVLGGLFRFSVSFSVILVELTGAEKQLPFLMIVLIIAKGIGDRFNQSILNHLCILLGLLYVGGQPESAIRKKQLVAGNAMDQECPTIKVLESEANLTTLLKNKEKNHQYTAFPVAEAEGREPNYLGMITRDDIMRAIEDYQKDSSNGPNSTLNKVDLSRYLCRPPVVYTDMKMTFIYRMHNSSGLEYIPVLNRYGPLRGLITRHQLVDLQNQVIDPHNIQGRFHNKRSYTLPPHELIALLDDEEDV